MQIFKNTFFSAVLFSTIIGSGTAIGECGIDCEVDADCDTGLLCADDHSIELRNKSYDPKKAYCQNIAFDYPKADVCYNPSMITIGPGAPFEPRGNMQLCEADCDFDSDCAEGYLCADEHGPELVAKNLHPRKANCPNEIAENHEVCFPSTLIFVPGGGGGGMFSYNVWYRIYQMIIYFASNIITFCFFLGLSQSLISALTMEQNTLTMVNVI
jgi:hypothetical protein